MDSGPQFTKIKCLYAQILIKNKFTAVGKKCLFGMCTLQTTKMLFLWYPQAETDSHKP